MTWIDWILVAIVAYAVLQGLRRGALAAAGAALAVLIAYGGASFFYASLAAAFGRILLSAPWQATGAFLVIFLAVNAILAIAASLLLGSANASKRSRLVGVVVGGIRGILLAAALLAIAMASPIGEPVAQDVGRSALAVYVAQGQIASVEWLNPRLPESMRLFGGGAARF